MSAVGMAFGPVGGGLKAVEVDNLFRDEIVVFELIQALQGHFDA